MFVKLFVLFAVFAVAAATQAWVTTGFYADSACTIFNTAGVYGTGQCVQSSTSSIGGNSLMYDYATVSGVTTVSVNYYSDYSCSTLLPAYTSTVATGYSTCTFSSLATVSSSFTLNSNYQSYIYATTCSTSSPVYAILDETTTSFTYNCLSSYTSLLPGVYTSYATIYEASCSGTNCGSSGTITITCFGGSETVQMESGETKALSEVAVGDSILAADRDGNTMFSKVISIPHGANSDPALFTKITTASGKDIQLTADHLIATSPCSNTDLSLTAASNVEAGMCLKSVDGLEEVVDVTTVKGRGLYTIVTEAEMVVVNGFVASPFAYNHAVGNAYYNIQRVANAVSPALLNHPLTKAAVDVFGSIATSVASL